ncbi:hypothetical protein [Chryseobacterium sp. 2987]|uniref:hypothetical protein n=1 Tax=Chryseobacterium sp. 2987 TaxID=2817767 RepID=UPI002866B211|nr:hypothetical protein [Chryseobacterium sp. 2987]MDR6919539.1 hypothetical protein [Chryseobacterium sp. 2987]
MEKDNRFMDYLFNEFVQIERRIGKSQSHRFLSIISNYIEWGFNYDNPEKAQQYARISFSSIEYAVFKCKTDLLDLKGKNEESEQVLMYKLRLKSLQYSEDEIANLLIERYKLNNPTEIISPYGQL